MDTENRGLIGWPRFTRKMVCMCVCFGKCDLEWLVTYAQLMFTLVRCSIKRCAAVAELQSN